MVAVSKINTTFLFRIILFFFLFIAFTKAEAQDTIVKRNNEIIISKIAEVTSTEIKYKLFNYQEGPLFIIGKWEIKSITYGNGLKENFDSIKQPLIPLTIKKDLSIIKSGKSYLYQSRRINELEMLDVARTLNDKKLNLIVKRTHDIRFARKSFSTAAVVLGGFGLLTYVGIIPISNKANPSPANGGRYNPRASRNANTTFRHSIGGYFMLAGLGCELVSLSIKINEIKHAHLVVGVYNKLIGN